MMTVKKFLFSVFLLSGIFLSSLTLSGCGEDDISLVRVGTNVWPGYEPIYLAQDLDYFNEDEIVLSRYPSATNVLQSFRDGNIDVAALTLDESLALALQDMDVEIFFVTNVSLGSDVIMAMPESGINSVRDLEGRVIGVESTALGAYMLVRSLQVASLPLESVKVLYVTVDETVDTLVNGDVDAVVTFEPYSSQLKKLGAQEIFSSRVIPNEIFDVLVSRKSFAVKNPDALKRLVGYWEKAIEFLYREPERAGAKIAKRFQMQADEAMNAFSGLTIPDKNEVRRLMKGGDESPLAESAARLSHILVESGVWGAPPNVSGIITDTYLE